VDLLKTLALYVALQVIRVMHFMIVMPLMNKMGFKLTMSKIALLSLSGVKGAFMLVLAIIARNKMKRN
jgi:hypothetical protein